MKHQDKPWHQRWLYELADMGIVKAIMLIWAICWIIVGISVLAIKALFSHFK